MGTIRDSINVIHSQRHGLDVLHKNIQEICKHPDIEVIEVTGFQRYYAHRCMDCEAMVGQNVSEQEIKAYIIDRELSVQRAIEKQVSMSIKKQSAGGSI